MFKITGLDKLERQLKEAQRALEGIDGNIGSVNFDPHDPESIESAVHSMEEMIDERLGDFSGNPIVAPLAEQMKANYRQGILDRAAEARLEGDSDSA